MSNLYCHEDLYFGESTQTYNSAHSNKEDIDTAPLPFYDTYQLSNFDIYANPLNMNIANINHRNMKSNKMLCILSDISILFHQSDSQISYQIGFLLNNGYVEYYSVNVGESEVSYNECGVHSTGNDEVTSNQNIVHANQDAGDSMVSLWKKYNMYNDRSSIYDKVSSIHIYIYLCSSNYYFPYYLFTFYRTPITYNRCSIGFLIIVILRDRKISTSHVPILRIFRLTSVYI